MSHTLDNLKQAIERYEQLVGGKQLGPRRFYNYVLERARTSDLQGGGWLQNLFKRRSSGPTKNRYALVVKAEPPPSPLPPPRIKPSRPPPPPPPRPPPPPTPHETLAPLESPNIDTYDPEHHGDEPTWAKSSLEYLQNRLDVHKTTYDMLKEQLDDANNNLVELGVQMEHAAIAKKRQRERVDEQKNELADAEQDVKDATLNYDNLDQWHTHLAHANQGLKRQVDLYGAAVTEWRRAIFDFSIEHRGLLTPGPSDPAPAPADLLPDLDGSAPINQYKAYLEHTYLDESKWPPEEDWPVLADKYMAWRKSTQPGRKPPPFGYGGPGYVNPNRPRPAAPPPAPSL